MLTPTPRHASPRHLHVGSPTPRDAVGRHVGLNPSPRDALRRHVGLTHTPTARIPTASLSTAVQYPEAEALWPVQSPVVEDSWTACSRWEPQPTAFLPTACLGEARSCCLPAFPRATRDDIRSALGRHAAA